MEGIVKCYDDSKGYGFITIQGNKDVFVHWSKIQEQGYRSLEAGQKVFFDLVETPKGLQARNVIKLLF